jgi:mRNA degradation ribonuclease J1/J2
MIKKRQEEFPNLKPLDIHEVEKEDTSRGQPARALLSVTHTIPDSMGIIIETPYGIWSLPATSSSTTSTASLPRPKKKSLLF